MAGKKYGNPGVLVVVKIICSYKYDNHLTCLYLPKLLLFHIFNAQTGYLITKYYPSVRQFLHGVIFFQL